MVTVLVTWTVESLGLLEGGWWLGFWLHEEPKKSAGFSRVDELGTVNLKCRLNDFPLLMSIWRKAWIRDFRCEMRAGGAHA